MASKRKVGVGNVANLTKQWGVSFVVHALILLILFMFTTDTRKAPQVVSVVSDLQEIVEEEIPEELMPDEEIDLDAEVALSPAAAGDGAIGESVAGLVNPMQASMQTAAVRQAISNSALNRPLQSTAVSMGLGQNVEGLKGGFEFATGAGGDDGVIDRITQEIIRQVNKNKTVVAWVMDSSGSLAERRESIAKRFDRIYKELDELGVNESGALLTAIVSLGDKTKFMLEQPTSDSEEVRKAIRAIKEDETGKENIFTAIRETALKYRRLQTSGRRTLMIVLLTDEIGDDLEAADDVVDLLQRYQIPLYAMGPMASFNRPVIYDKQTVKDSQGKEWDFWEPVKRGPFTRTEEQLRVPFNAYTYKAGFGPFFLTKITRETGGLFFVYDDSRIGLGGTYEPEILLQYKANYGSKEEYAAEIGKTDFRKTLMGIIEAGNAFWHVDFPHRWIYAAEWEKSIKERQADIAKFIEYAGRALPALEKLEDGYAKETNLRWRANYLLTYARVLQGKVRADEYMWALAAFRMNPLRLKDPKKNNAWRYVLDDKIRVGYKTDVDPMKLEGAKMTDPKAYEKAKEMLEKAIVYYQKTIDEHSGTPWAVAAQHEKNRLVGFHWVEDYERNFAATPEERKRREEARKNVKKL